MKNKFISTCIILLGNVLLTLSVGVFILPYNILSGGVAGIAVALDPLFHLNRELTADILVVGLFVLGWIFLGKEFMAKTFLSTLAYPVMLGVFTRFFTVQQLDPLIASLFGGLLGGAGVGLVMSEGASTGGMDIPPLIVNKITKIKLSILVLITDGLTVLLGLIAYDLQTVLIGMISVFASTYMIDKVLMMNGISSKQVQIISDQYEMIMDEIHSKLGRGTTVTDVVGGYTGNARKSVLVIVTRDQYNALLKIIYKYDEKAFVITTDVTEVHGEGFTFGFKV